jgi:hypothetical protein
MCFTTNTNRLQQNLEWKIKKDYNLLLYNVF